MGDKNSLGEFEHHVLLAILRLGDDAYTTSILELIESVTERDVSAAAVYIAIRRMERAGLVRSRLRRAVERNERRERRYVRVTPAGLELVRETRRRLVRFWDGLAPLGGEP